MKIRPHPAPHPHNIQTYIHTSFIIFPYTKMTETRHGHAIMTWPLPAEVSKAVCIWGNYLMFILAITEFHSPNTPTPSSYPEYRWLLSPKQEVTMCSGLIRWPFLPILLYLAHALYAPEGDLCHDKKRSPFLSSGDSI